MPYKLQKRLRIFAGPNGSGKSTLYQNFPPEIKRGIYVNADDIEKELRENGSLDFIQFQMLPIKRKLQNFIASHRFNNKVKNQSAIDISKNILKLPSQYVTSYWAAMIADYIRKTLIKEGKSLSFETVMSGVDKIELMQMAIKQGYKIYLYFMCTEDPIINIDRIQYRVSNGTGHSVPDKKVKDRYYKSLELLANAVLISYRSYMFDTTGENDRRLCAEKTPRLLRVCKPKEMPHWLYKYLLVKNFDRSEPLPLRKLK
ncbi:MAG: hypothetical protein ABUK01_05335 [Leptospirales bacterium]